VDGDVDGDLHDQAPRVPVGQPGHPPVRGDERRQSWEVLVLGRPGLGGHGHRDAEAAVVAVQPGDVEGGSGPLGDAEHRGHARPPGRLQHGPHRRGVDGQGALGVAARIDRPGERELGEHREPAALHPGLLEHGPVPGQVAGQIARLGVQGGAQDSHHVSPARGDGLPEHLTQRSSTA
jgi:hypothetical protein